MERDGPEPINENMVAYAYNPTRRGEEVGDSSVLALPQHATTAAAWTVHCLCTSRLHIPGTTFVSLPPTQLQFHAAHILKPRSL